MKQKPKILNVSKKLKRGFTLIEIMIVVLIIGMLLAIAVPNFMHARAASRYKAVIGNLTKIDQAKTQFQMDKGLSPGAACNLGTDLVPSYIATSPTGPLSTNVYVANVTGTNPTCDGKDLPTWNTNCAADATAAACGL